MNGSIDDADARQQSIWTELPSFVERGSGYIDGWKPGELTGEFDLDFLTGELYADIAVRYARQIKDPAFIAMVQAAIYFKTTRGLMVMGGCEQGFLNRLARLAYVGSLS